MNKKVAIQGYEGSFHQVAARHFFGKNVEVITCDTFREVVKIGGDVKLSDGAVMAIENSIAGSILPNYNLIQKSNLQVIGEPQFRKQWDHADKFLASWPVRQIRCRINRACRLCTWGAQRKPRLGCSFCSVPWQSTPDHRRGHEPSR